MPIGVGAAEEVGAELSSAMVDADPFGALRSTIRLCAAGVVKELPICDCCEACRWANCCSC